MAWGPYDSDTVNHIDFNLIYSPPVKKTFPFVSVFLAAGTLAASLAVATVVNGSPWSTVPVLQLRSYGGVDNGHVANGEWWRLVTAQFVHVRPAHMLLNVITLFLLALCVERTAGSLRLSLLWMASGIAGTYASIYSVPPHDIGSGASQAVMGIAGAAIVVIRRNLAYPSWLKVTLVVTLGTASVLDLLTSSKLKPGHVVGFLVGLILAVAIVPQALCGSRKSISAIR
jgi:membrane associated rhomboid family serine protease